METNRGTTKKPIIGISIGDLNGIGLEVIMKALSDERMLNFCTPVIYCGTTTLNYHKKVLDLKDFNFQIINKVEEANPKKVNLLNIWEDVLKITLGEPNPELSKYTVLSLTIMVNDAKAKKIDGMVTAPIDKAVIQSQSFSFPGHTEFFAEQFESKTLMFMISESMKVAVVTGHIPVSSIAESVTTPLILEKLRLMYNSLLKDFNFRAPKMAVLGLNPHAGDKGLLGKEDGEIIQPAIDTAKARGVLVYGPFPADGYFGSGHYLNFDGTLAMYHDQGLAPFKLLSFGNGVNYTAGLPIPRTSPDHGTGYGIAGKNQADESSFREAIYLVCEIIKTRNLFEEVTANPLQKQFIVDKERKPED